MRLSRFLLHSSVRRVTIPHYKPKAAPIEVVITRRDAQIRKWLDENLPKTSRDPKSLQKVVGFDVEWKPSYFKGIQNKISLVQLATPQSALLIQMKYVEEIPLSLVEVVSSKDIMKVGVGILEDLQRLEQDFGVPFNNFHDISSAAKRIEPDGRNKTGLAALVERFLGELTRYDLKTLMLFRPLPPCTICFEKTFYFLGFMFIG
jgi:hypothetical protein